MIACITWKSLNAANGRWRETSSFKITVRCFQGIEDWLQRTYMVIPNAHTSLSFDCLTLPRIFHSSGDQNAGVPFVVVVTWPSDRLMSAAICAHPKSLMTALREGAMRMLSLVRVRIYVEEEKKTTHRLHVGMYHAFAMQIF